MFAWEAYLTFLGVYTGAYKFYSPVGGGPRIGGTEIIFHL